MQGWFVEAPGVILQAKRCHELQVTYLQVVLSSVIAVHVNGVFNDMDIFSEVAEHVVISQSCRCLSLLTERFLKVRYSDLSCRTSFYSLFTLDPLLFQIVFD